MLHGLFPFRPLLHLQGAFMIFRIFELLFVVFLIYGVVTQMIIPIWRGSLLFPYFRKEKILQHALAAAHQRAVEDELKRNIKKVR